MRTLTVICAGTILLGISFAFSWLLDRACARWYGGLTGSQLAPHQGGSAEWARVWAAVNGADLPPSYDPCVVRNPQRGGAQ